MQKLLHTLQLPTSNFQLHRDPRVRGSAVRKPFPGFSKNGVKTSQLAGCRAFTLGSLEHPEGGPADRGQADRDLVGSWALPLDGARGNPGAKSKGWKLGVTASRYWLAAAPGFASLTMKSISPGLISPSSWRASASMVEGSERSRRASSRRRVLSAFSRSIAVTSP